MLYKRKCYIKEKNNGKPGRHAKSAIPRVLSVEKRDIPSNSRIRRSQMTQLYLWRCKSASGSNVYNASGVVQLSPPIPRRIMYSGAGFRLRRECNKKITGLPNEKNSIISGAAFLPIPGPQPINAAVILRRESGHLFLSIARNGRERSKICYAANGIIRLIRLRNPIAINISGFHIFSNNREIVSRSAFIPRIGDILYLGDDNWLFPFWITIKS